MSSRQRRASNERSRRVQQAAIGTHVVSTSRRASHTKVNLGSRRVATRANRGQINQVMPSTSTRESRKTYAARSRRRGFVVQDAARKRKRDLLVIIALIVAAVVVAGAVAWFVFTSNISSKMSLNDSAVSSALVAPSNASDSYYILVAGEYYDPAQAYDGPHLLTLVRVDPTSKTLTLLSIPANIEVTCSDGKYHMLSAAQTVGGDAELISKISSLTGVSIAHYLKTDATGFQKIVDALGGITVAVPEEVDDPHAGSVYIPAGTQTLDGAAAFVLCRADNYTESVATRAKNQTAVLSALMDKTMGRSSTDFASLVDTLSSNLKTDMTFDQISALAKAFGDGENATIYQTRVPGTSSVEADGTYFSISKTALATLMETVNAGDDPTQKRAQTSFDPAQVTVTVKNGAGVTGGATEVANIVKGYGYQVPTTGNADSYVYDETLVVYKDSSKLPQAEALVDALGVGRTVEASYYYTFDTDVMVIIGKDWKPLT